MDGLDLVDENSNYFQVGYNQETPGYAQSPCPNTAPLWFSDYV